MGTVNKTTAFLHWLTWTIGFGLCINRRNFGLAILAHTGQCAQVWLFGIRIGHKRFGYRTHGDATPRLLTYKDGGWWLPWQKRYGSGLIV
jgi:hypothetical protein